MQLLRRESEGPLERALGLRADRGRGRLAALEQDHRRDRRDPVALGEIMRESVVAALSYIRSRANELQVDPSFLDATDLHIHLPENAIPKDGPSAGITIATAIVSALTHRPVRSNLAMTGEVTLLGSVLGMIASLMIFVFVIPRVLAQPQAVAASSIVTISLVLLILAWVLVSGGLVGLYESQREALGALGVAGFVVALVGSILMVVVLCV